MSWEHFVGLLGIFERRRNCSDLGYIPLLESQMQGMSVWLGYSTLDNTTLMIVKQLKATVPDWTIDNRRKHIRQGGLHIRTPTITEWIFENTMLLKRYASQLDGPSQGGAAGRYILV